MFDYEIFYWTIVVVCIMPALSMVLDAFRYVFLLKIYLIYSSSYFRQMYELKHKDEKLRIQMDKLLEKKKAIAKKYSFIARFKKTQGASIKP